MRFFERKRRQPPAIIIVSLIDILIVLLIFMMVTTTFKRHPALRLTLPESSQPREGASEASLIVTVANEPPFFFLGEQRITLDALRAELAARVAREPDLALSIRGDTTATWGHIVEVMDAAKAARVKSISAQVKAPGGN